MNNKYIIRKETTMKHTVSNSDSDLRKYLTQLDNSTTTADPTVDDVVSTRFSYEDIVHYLKIETTSHIPGEYNNQTTHRIAKWCRLFLEQGY
jgi:hypothetical protein